jgi:hypothetical protein
MRLTGRLIRALAFASASLLPTVARADSPKADPDAVEWSESWRRVRVWEVVDSLALTVGDTLFEDHVPLPDHATWTKPILFDTWARNVLRGRTAAVQSFASTSSDFMFKAGALVPFLVDDYFGALSLHENADVAWQLTVMDLQSFGVAGLASLAAEHGVGRARPYTLSCGGPADVELDAQGHLLHTCGGSNDFRSFFSGHATSTATAAGLVCIHHQHLPLFGGGFADLAPCLLMIGVSVTAGVLRLVYDEHWTSDVIAGWVDGALAGYVLPWALHFRSERPIGEIKAGTLEMAPTLLPRQTGAELGVVGTF